MKIRLPFLLVTALLVASLAACGGSTKVPANAVAVVNGVPITTADFNTFLTSAIAVAQSQGQPKPTPGSPQYIAMRNQVIAYLVQFAEVKQQADKEGVSVSQDEITKFIANIAKTKFAGSMTKLTAALKQQGLTMAAARQEVYLNLLAQKVRTKVTAGSAAVTAAALKAYYTQNLSQYTKPEQTSRPVRHILVKSKVLANRLRRQVNSANFAALAKKYSTDTGSASQGGKLTAIKGQLVKPFEDVAFALKTGQISAPVHSQFGWHIIQALGPVTTVKAHTSTFREVAATIKQTLLQQEQDKLWQQWLSDLTKTFAGKVIYQSGYAPPATTALPTTT